VRHAPHKPGTLEKKGTRQKGLLKNKASKHSSILDHKKSAIRHAAKNSEATMLIGRAAGEGRKEREDKNFKRGADFLRPKTAAAYGRGDWSTHSKVRQKPLNWIRNFKPEGGGEGGLGKKSFICSVWSNVSDRHLTDDPGDQTKRIERGGWKEICRDLAIFCSVKGEWTERQKGEIGSQDDEVGTESLKAQGKDVALFQDTERKGIAESDGGGRTIG